VLLFLSISDAAVPTLLEVIFLGALVCERAIPAAVFDALLVLLLLRTLEAAEAAILLITSLFSIVRLLELLPKFGSNFGR